MIATAERKAEGVWEALRGPIEAGRDVVVIEPTDLAMFRRRYQKLLPPAAASAIRDATYDVMEYVGRLLDEGRESGPLRRGDGTRVAYHSHCQQRTLDLEGPTVETLRSLGYDVETTSVECCGMAGSFGYKTEYYELSMEVGADLRDQITENGSPNQIVAASGTSCQEQLEDLLSTRVPHPIEVIAPT
jgi:Fe-S oxidoreductase